MALGRLAVDRRRAHGAQADVRRRAGIYHRAAATFQVEIDGLGVPPPRRVSTLR